MPRNHCSFSSTPIPHSSTFFISKLRFEGNWNNAPRDAANLTRFAGKQLERQLNWEVVGLQRDWQDWTDGPVLYLASDSPVDLNEDAISKLRQYIEAGGLLFTHSDAGSKKFDEFAEELGKRLFPQYAMETIAENHMVYSMVFPATVKPVPVLRGVSNGARLLMVHSPGDLAKGWAMRVNKTQRPMIELGANIVLYASGKRDLKNRAESIVVLEPSEKVIAEFGVARVKHKGNWNPEPGAWRRMARVFEWDTSAKLIVGNVEISDLKFETTRFAHLTGTSGDELKIAADEAKAMREFVEVGGILLVDECGGSGAFTSRAKVVLTSSVFPGKTVQTLPQDHPILGSRGMGMEDVTKPRMRLHAMEKLSGKPPRLQMIKAGEGLVIISDVDVSSGFLGTNTWGIVGYEPGYAQALMKNVLLWGMGVEEKEQ